MAYGTIHMGVRTGVKKSKSGISVLFLCVWAELRRGSVLVAWPADSWCHNKTMSSESSFEMLENIRMSGWMWKCLLAALSQSRVLSGMLSALREDMWRVGRDPEAPSWIGSSLPLFLDCTCSDLREEIDCSDLKYSCKNPSDARGWRESNSAK